jgi:hypothetical protein
MANKLQVDGLTNIFMFQASQEKEKDRYQAGKSKRPCILQNPLNLLVYEYGTSEALIYGVY